MELALSFYEVSVYGFNDCIYTRALSVGHVLTFWLQFISFLFSPVFQLGKEPSCFVL